MAEGYKSEKATPKKRRDERKKGNVFKSQDAIAVATLVGSFAVLWVLRDSFVERLAAFLDLCFAEAANPSAALLDVINEVSIQGVVVLALTVGPVLLVTILCAIAATFAQTRFLVSGESIKPKFNRISPLQGIKRLFSLRSVVEALKGLLKISILMIIIYLTIRDMFLEASRYLYTDLAVSSAHMAEVATNMVMRIILAFIALAGADFGYQWWDYERQLKMTKQEVKEETWWSVTPPTSPWPCATSPTRTMPPLCWPRARTPWPPGLCRWRNSTASPPLRTYLWPVRCTHRRS